MYAVYFTLAWRSGQSPVQPNSPAHQLRNEYSQWLIGIVGTAMAFLLGYAVVTNYPLDESWHQRYLSPALNYACTGHFGPLRLAENPPAEDVAAAKTVDDFLHVRTLHFSCSSFPRHAIAT